MIIKIYSNKRYNRIGMVAKMFNLDYSIITASQRHNTGSSFILKVLKNRSPGTPVSRPNPVIHDLIDVDFTKLPYFFDRKKRYEYTVGSFYRKSNRCKKILKIYE